MKAELHQAWQWILDQSKSPETAHKWFNGITRAIGSLDRNPKRCRLAPENDYFLHEIRQLLFGRRHGQYRVLFTIEENSVVILHIRHSARRFLDENE